jgi:hypothetical protein
MESVLRVVRAMKPSTKKSGESGGKELQAVESAVRTIAISVEQKSVGVYAPVSTAERRKLLKVGYRNTPQAARLLLNSR